MKIAEIYITADSGEVIHEFAQAALSLARLFNCPVYGLFNDTRLDAHPKENLNSILTRWEARRGQIGERK
jgi:hypothetical protein